MLESIVFTVITVSIIVAFLLAWIFYQKARNRERMYLLKKGEKLEEIYFHQKQNKFTFIFPWLKLGVVTTGLSLSFLGIAFLILHLENDQELFKGFLITFIIGIWLGLSFLINHFIGKKGSEKHG